MRVAIVELAKLKDDLRWARTKASLRSLSVIVAVTTFMSLALGSLGSALRIAGKIAPDSFYWFSIGRDGAIVESAGYIFFAFSTGLLLRIYMQKRQPLVLMLALFVLYLLVDDMFMLHDQARLMIGNTLGYENSMFSKEDIGEAIYTATAFVTAAGLLITFFHRIRAADVSFCMPVILSVTMFLSMAVGLDQVHQLLEHVINIGVIGDHAFILAEDGGELVSQGLTLLASWGLFLKTFPVGLNAARPVLHHTTIAAE